MFGYITPNGRALSDEQKAEYRAGYCGVCRQLHRRHGGTARMLLSYDMAFLYALLTSLYEPETRRHAMRCAAHPLRPVTCCVNRYSDYAADMNLLLGYYKLRDDWLDDRNPVSYAGDRLLRRRAEELRERYPRQSAAIEAELARLAEIERSGDAPMDAAANCFGALLGQVFSPHDDEWRGVLCDVGAALGRFIYMMDAYEDLPGDRRKGGYNPLIPIADAPDFEARAYDLLTVPMAECADAFERLPLVDGVETLRNILYAGVWMRYQAIHHRRAHPAKGTR